MWEKMRERMCEIKKKDVKIKRMNEKQQPTQINKNIISKPWNHPSINKQSTIYKNKKPQFFL